MQFIESGITGLFLIHNTLAFKIHQILQLDLVDMKSQKVEYKGKNYKYVLSLLDVFSRFRWLSPLPSKHSKEVKKELEKIFDQHGIPQTIQSDRGKEFYGAVKSFCEREKIEMTRSRPYHPQSQGKVERSHRTFRTFQLRPRDTKEERSQLGKECTKICQMFE